MRPRFSVFIPVWNDADWLPGAIESVLAQAYPDWELIVGDNASSDDLEAVAARYADPRVRYHRWQTHTDIFENYNRTLMLCRHDWLQLLCADDRLQPGCLERMAERIEAFDQRVGRLAMVVTACRRVDPNGRPAEAEWYRHGQVATFHDGRYDARSWLLAMAQPGYLPWNYGSVAINREVLAEAGSFFRPEVGECADAELALRIAAYGDVIYIDEPLLDYTVRGSSDNWSRSLRSLQCAEPLAPIGAAFLPALRAHSARRCVSREEQQAVFGIISRAHLQRALAHRTLPAGRGRLEAARDVLRAVRYDRGVLLSPRHLALSLAVLTAPRRVLDWATTTLTERRRGLGPRPTASSTPADQELVSS